MDAVRFFQKYLPEGDGLLLDVDPRAEGVQPRTGDEQGLGQDFDSLSFADKVLVTSRIARDGSREDRRFVIAHSPLQGLLGKDRTVGRVHEAFAPLDALLARPDHSVDEARWLIQVVTLYQQGEVEPFRRALSYEMEVRSQDVARYEGLRHAWEDRYVRTIRAWEERHPDEAKKDASPYFDLDADGVVDRLDADPLDPLTTKDTDGDGVDDLLDAAPTDAKVFFNPAELASRQPASPYTVSMEPDGKGGQRAVIEVVVGLRANPGESSPPDLEKLKAEFSTRVRPHLVAAVPEGLRSSVRLAISFTTDLSRAHRIVFISGRSKGELTNTASLWRHDIEGQVILHELGHRAFGLPDRYHKGTAKNYWSEDRTFSPHFLSFVAKNDIMLEDLPMQFAAADLRRIIAFGTRRGQALFQSGFLSFELHGEMAALKMSSHTGDRATPALAETILDRLARYDASARALQQDPFLQARAGRLRTYHEETVRWVGRLMLERADNMAFVDLDAAIRMLDESQAVVRRQKGRFHFASERTFSGLEQSMARRRSLFERARALLTAGKFSELSALLSDPRERFSLDEATLRAEIEKLRNEWLPTGVVIEKIICAYVNAGQKALPRYTVAFTISSGAGALGTQRTISVNIGLPLRGEDPTSFRGRVLEVLRTRIKDEAKASEPKPFSLENGGIGVGAGFLMSLAGPQVFSADVRASWRLASASTGLFLQPQLALRSSWAQLSQHDAPRGLSILPGFAVGMNFYRGWHASIGGAPVIPLSGSVKKGFLGEVETGYRFRSADISVAASIDSEEVPAVGLRANWIF